MTPDHYATLVSREEALIRATRELVHRGALAYGPGGAPVVVGPKPFGITPLQAAIYEVCTRPDPDTTDPLITAELDLLEQHVIAADLVRDVEKSTFGHELFKTTVQAGALLFALAMADDGEVPDWPYQAIVTISLCHLTAVGYRKTVRLSRRGYRLRQQYLGVAR